MARSDDDTWDLATSVGATATLVAAARALATRQNDPLVADPFAEPLVRAVGIAPFTRALEGDDISAADGARMLIDVVAVRTRFFDDFLLEAAAAGLRQAVMDSTTPHRRPGSPKGCWSTCRQTPRTGCSTPSRRCRRPGAGSPRNTTPTAGRGSPDGLRR